MNMKNRNLDVIIPVYNEENAVLSTIEHISEILQKNDSIEKYNIIVVDDGSSDNTANILKDNNLNFKLIVHEKNMGYGAALKTGIENSESDYFCITDADGTYPNEDIPKLFNCILEDDLDMITGARVGANASIPLIRRPAKWFIGRMANHVTSKKIKDINCGLRVYKRISYIPFKPLVPDGFSFTATTLLGMISAGYKVKSVPINYYQREGKSKIRPIRDTLNFMKLVLKIGLYFAPLKVFLPVGITLFIIGISWALYTFFVFDQIADLSSIVLIVSSFQVILLALLAELINHRVPNRYFK